MTNNKMANLKLEQLIVVLKLMQQFTTFDTPAWQATDDKAILRHRIDELIYSTHQAKMLIQLSLDLALDVDELTSVTEAN